MRFVLFAGLALIVGIVVNEISSQFNRSSASAVWRHRRVYIAALVAVAIGLGATAQWVVGGADSDAGPEDESPEQQPAPAADGVTGTSESATSIDPRTAFCAEASALVPADTSSPEANGPASSGGLMAQTEVANVTCGDSDYSTEVGAGFDHVVKAQVLYQNVDLTAPALMSLRLAVDQSGNGTATIRSELATDRVTVESTTDVHFQGDAYLEFIPGSVTWRRNVSPPPASPRYANEALPDTVMSEPYPLTRLAPGAGETGSVTALFRVRVASVSVRIEARSPATDDWLQQVDVRAGSAHDLRIRVQNAGNAPLRQLLVRLSLPPTTIQYVDDSLVVTTGDEPVVGSRPDNEFTSSGVELGDVEVGQEVVIEFRVVVDSEIASNTELRLVGVAQALGLNEFYNTLVLRASV